MDEKEVREAIEELVEWLEDYEDALNRCIKGSTKGIKESIQNTKTAIEALEKQLAKEIKVIDKERSEEFGDVEFYCPNCNSHYLCDIADMPNYCSDCGIRFNT